MNAVLGIFVIEALYAISERLIFGNQTKDIDYLSTKQLVIRTYFVLHLFVKSLYNPLFAILSLLIDLSFRFKNHLLSRYISGPVTILTFSTLVYVAHMYLGIGVRYIEEIVQDQKCEHYSSPYYILAFIVGGHLLNLVDVVLFN